MLYWVRTDTCGSWSRSTQWVACRTHLNSTASHLSSPVRACPATSSNDFNFNSKLLLGSCLMIYTYCYIHMDECTTRLRKTITISIATTWGILDPNTQILWFAWSDGEGAEITIIPMIGNQQWQSIRRFPSHSRSPSQSQSLLWVIQCLSSFFSVFLALSRMRLLWAGTDSYSVRSQMRTLSLSDSVVPRFNKE